MEASELFLTRRLKSTGEYSKMTSCSSRVAQRLPTQSAGNEEAQPWVETVPSCAMFAAGLAGAAAAREAPR